MTEYEHIGTLTVTDRPGLVTLHEESGRRLTRVGTLTFTRRERQVKHPLRVRRCFIVGRLLDVIGMSDMVCAAGGE